MGRIKPPLFYIMERQIKITIADEVFFCDIQYKLDQNGEIIILNSFPDEFENLIKITLKKIS